MSIYIAIPKHLKHVLPFSHLKTAIQGPISVVISLHRKKLFNYYDWSINC